MKLYFKNNVSIGSAILILSGDVHSRNIGISHFDRKIAKEERTIPMKTVDRKPTRTFELKTDSKKESRNSNSKL